MLGANRRYRAGAHIGDAASVEDGPGRAGARIEQRQDAKLGRKAELVVVDEVADDLDTRGIDRRLDGAAQHVEMPVGDAGLEMNAGFDHRFTPALTGEARFHGRQYLVVGDLELVDIEAVEIGDVDGRQELISSTQYVYTLLGGHRKSTDRSRGLT